MRLARVTVVAAAALAIIGCAWSTEWAGLTKVQATEAAKKEAIRSDYRGDARLFNLNLWSIQARPMTVGGRKCGW